MRTLVFYLIVVSGAPFGGEARLPTTAVRAEAPPASAELAPLPGDARLFRLPALSFRLRVMPTCTVDTSPQSLSVSVADTRARFAAADLQDVAVVEAALDIPQQQLGPVRVDGFCRADADDGRSRFLLRHAFTAQMSLRCAGSDRQTVAYATLPLDVELVCRRSDADAVRPDQPAGPDDSPDSA